DPAVQFDRYSKRSTLTAPGSSPTTAMSRSPAVTCASPLHNGRGREVAASPKLMINEAERRFPARIRIGVPIGGFGERINHMQTWLDENCGTNRRMCFSGPRR